MVHCSFVKANNQFKLIMVPTEKAYNLTMCLTWAETELSAPGADRFSVPGATSSASESPSTPIADS